jgi:uncharacterized protein (DUF433 family)
LLVEGDGLRKILSQSRVFETGRRGDQIHTDLRDTSGANYADSMVIDRITRNPKVMGGKPCIRGMRITVGTITGLVATGHPWDGILRVYPFLEEEDIRAALSDDTRLAEAYDMELQPA